MHAHAEKVIERTHHYTKLKLKQFKKLITFPFKIFRKRGGFTVSFAIEKRMQRKCKSFEADLSKN